MRILMFIVLAIIGVLGILISLPVFWLAALGLLGALADVGPDENRKMGIQLLAWGLLFLIGGVVLCVFCLRAFARNRQRKSAEPGAAPNGGPAVPAANSGVTEGPPSVS